MRWFPESTPADARRVVLARAVRAFADGAVSVLLASYLSQLGLTPFQIGALVTGTLVGSAALTLAVGLTGATRSRRTILLAATLLMIATGLGFASMTAFVPLLAVGVMGTLNPTGGDVSVFLPTEQAILADVAPPLHLTALFARYNVTANLAGALGALASALPTLVASRFDVDLLAANRGAFVGYALMALAAGSIYRRMSPAVEGSHTRGPAVPLAKSRGVVLRLAALFSLDSAAGGLVVQSLLALWLFRRFGISVETAATVFFGANLLAGFSQLASPLLAARIGLVPTMVFTHIPANVFLILAAFMPTAPLAILFLLLRMSLSQMDVPARQSFVMAVVPPEERAAAATVTNVPRSLASATTPLVTGWLLGLSTFGWPLVFAGVGKILYDLSLLAQFRHMERKKGE